ncbi:hypothetical protein [Aquabacterium sp.]|nr:hypothetical protein [Aquabacterium sp.]MDI1259420.1 hypothetical protein [Aquabacterium sp.]
MLDILTSQQVVVHYDNTLRTKYFMHVHWRKKDWGELSKIANGDLA